MSNAKLKDREELTASWHALCEKTLQIASKLSEEGDPNVGGADQVGVNMWAMALLCRSVNNFIGVQSLLRKNLIVEARTLVRCCYENLFRLGYLSKKGSAAVEEWQWDYHASTKALGNDLLTWSRNNRKRLEVQDEFDIFMQDLNTKKSKKSVLKREADEAGLADAYTVYRVLSGDAAHPTDAVLGRHLHADDDGTLAVSGASVWFDENEELETLELGCQALLHVCSAANDLLLLKHGRRLEELIGKHKRLTERTLSSLG